MASGGAATPRQLVVALGRLAGCEVWREYRGARSQGRTIEAYRTGARRLCESEVLKRIEPNLLMAVATAIPLILLIATATLFGTPGQLVKYLAIAIIVPAAFVPLNGMMARRMGMQRPPMIHPEAASTAVWASLFPALIILAAGVPLVFPGHDYGLLVIIAAVFFGGTVESAVKAARAH